MIILGLLDCKEGVEKYNLKSQSKHFLERENRFSLVSSLAKPLYFYEVSKNNSRQIHCLYDDASLIVYNKKTMKAITIILLNTNGVKKYLSRNDENIYDFVPLKLCAKLHGKLKIEDIITSCQIESVLKKKEKYFKFNFN